MYQLDKKEFGAFVARLRKEQGYTQKELAARLCLSDKAISKWETGVSIPDTPMLVPLAQALGVTVTELLLCRRQTPGESLDPSTVEEVVQQAIRYPKTRVKRAWSAPGPWVLLFLAALVLAGARLVLHPVLDLSLDLLPIPVGLAAGFGVYFCLFAPLRLPDYYDQNKISGFMDGPVQLNLVGLSFNNRNWPYILRVCRGWCCAVLGLLPWLDLGVQLALSALYPEVWSGLMLILTLGGLFLPIYITGKRYESQ